MGNTKRELRADEQDLLVISSRMGQRSFEGYERALQFVPPEQGCSRDNTAVVVNVAMGDLFDSLSVSQSLKILAGLN
jgi:hypothetical protein